MAIMAGKSEISCVKIRRFPDESAGSDRAMREISRKRSMDSSKRSWSFSKSRSKQSLVHLEMCCYMVLFDSCPKFFFISEMTHSCCLHHPCLCWFIAYTNSNSIKTHLRCLNHKSHVSVFIDKAAIKTNVLLVKQQPWNSEMFVALKGPAAPPLPLPGRYWEVPRPANTCSKSGGIQGSDTVQLGCNFHSQLSPWKCHSSVGNEGPMLVFRKFRGYNKV